MSASKEPTISETFTADLTTRRERAKAQKPTDKSVTLTSLWGRGKLRKQLFACHVCRVVIEGVIVRLGIDKNLTFKD